MCSDCESRFHGWLGWSDLPKPVSPAPTGDWIDLTHPLSEELSRSTAFPRPVIRRLIEQPAAPANVTEVQMVVHHGTHVDAPRHFLLDGPTFEEIPLDRLHGPGVVWRIEKEPLAVIGVADLERARPRVQRGDIVLLDTGWARHVNTDLYEEHPHLDEEAAQWLVGHGVRLLGVDFSTPDLTAHHRPPGFTWPVHQVLLRRGVLIAEHVANLAPLAGRRIETMFLALPIAGADGAPARAIARTVD